MSRVFIVNDGGSRSKNLEDAERFGQLLTVSHQFVYPDTLDDRDQIAGKVFYDLDTAARSFEPGEDYVLPIGDVIQVAQFVALVSPICEMKGKPLRLLRWDGHERQYYVVRMKHPVLVRT